MYHCILSSFTLKEANLGFRLTMPVHEHSKQLLKKAIMNDTEFLASRNIMDYSLLLGIDETKKELTVGIVGKSIYT